MRALPSAAALGSAWWAGGRRGSGVLAGRRANHPPALPPPHPTLAAIPPAGYLVMLNGGLAQNPYWVAAWVAAFAGLAGLLAPDRSLRCAARARCCGSVVACLRPSLGSQVPPASFACRLPHASSPASTLPCPKADTRSSWRSSPATPLCSASMWAAAACPETPKCLPERCAERSCAQRPWEGHAPSQGPHHGNLAQLLLRAPAI